MWGARRRRDLPKMAVSGNSVKGSNRIRYLANGRSTSRRTCPSTRRGVSGPALYPVENNLGCEWASVTALVNEPRKRLQLSARYCKFKAKPPPFGKVIFGK